MTCDHDLAAALAERRMSCTIAPRIERAIAAMAVRIRNDYAGSVPVYLTVMHGGLPFAAQLALDARRARARPGVRLPACDALSRRDHRRRTASGSIARRRRCAGAGCCWSTTSSTKATRSRRCAPGAVDEGARDVRIAALAVKRHDRCVPGLRADYAGVEVPDRYVFGYGMDYHEQGRNLPAIYALKEHDATNGIANWPSSAAPASTRSAELERCRSHLPRHAVRRASGPVRVGTLAGKRVAFLARHGEGHSRAAAPHQLSRQPGRAADARRARVLALNTVGGITDRLRSARARSARTS